MRTNGTSILIFAALLNPLLGTQTARADAGKERNFYQVLDDLMSDFEFDMKNGNVQGLKDLSIRNIATSENIPPSFRNHLDLLLTEKILKTSKTRVIQCLQCRSKKASVTGDQVVITSPETNPVEMNRIAKQAGIVSFMDAAFTYQPGGMVLSLTISDPESAAVIWSKSYNSETSRAAAVRRGVDFSQVDDSRKQTEYAPTVQYRIILHYLFEPNVSGTTGCLVPGFRMVERYDNRKKEVGFELDVMFDSSSIVGQTEADKLKKNLYTGVNLSLLFLHAWNLIGEEENYNKPRGSIMLGIGGTYASGFLGGLVRTSYEWRLARHWAATAVVGYRPPSTAFLSSSPVGEVSGVEFGLGVSLLF